MPFKPGVLSCHPKSVKVITSSCCSYGEGQFNFTGGVNNSKHSAKDIYFTSLLRGAAEDREPINKEKGGNY